MGQGNSQLVVDLGHDKDSLSVPGRLPLETLSSGKARPSIVTMADNASAGMADDSQLTVKVRLVHTKTHEERQLTLRVDQPVEVGRSSRTEVKNLQASPDNGRFDCPVISRQHALLSIDDLGGGKVEVIIKDLSSKHGTEVNADKLQPYNECPLVSGDIIKLGGEITVGNVTHDGIYLKYILDEVRIPECDEAASGLRGFRAPSSDVSSEDDSDVESVASVEIIRHAPLPARTQGKKDIDVIFIDELEPEPEELQASGKNEAKDTESIDTAREAQHSNEAPETMNEDPKLNAVAKVLALPRDGEVKHFSPFAQGADVFQEDSDDDESDIVEQEKPQALNQHAETQRFAMDSLLNKSEPPNVPYDPVRGSQIFNQNQYCTHLQQLHNDNNASWGIYAPRQPPQVNSPWYSEICSPNNMDANQMNPSNLLNPDCEPVYVDYYASESAKPCFGQPNLPVPLQLSAPLNVTLASNNLPPLPSTVPTLHKISIPDIVEQPEQDVVKAQSDPVDPPASTSLGHKRKAEDMDEHQSIDALANTPTKKIKTAGPSKSELFRGVVIGAIGGAVSTMAFLSSPAAVSLIEWLEK